MWGRGGAGKGLYLIDLLAVSELLTAVAGLPVRHVVLLVQDQGAHLQGGRYLPICED